MSTRSELAVQMEDGTYTQAYVHYDGYPEHMMPALRTINTLDAARELVSKGDIRSIEDGKVDYFADSFESDNCSNSSLKHPVRNQQYLYIFSGGEWVQS